jgi:hypothetical protein
MQVGGNSPAIVSDRYTVIGVNEYLDISTVACKGLVNRVVYYLVNQVV